MNEMDERIIRPMGFGRPGFGFHHGGFHHGFHGHGFGHGFGFGAPLLGFGTGLLAGSLINRPYGYGYAPYGYGGYGGYPYSAPYYGNPTCYC